jgi:hypothetical protein
VTGRGVGAGAIRIRADLGHGPVRGCLVVGSGYEVRECQGRTGAGRQLAAIGELPLDLISARAVDTQPEIGAGLSLRQGC